MDGSVALVYLKKVSSSISCFIGSQLDAYVFHSNGFGYNVSYKRQWMWAIAAGKVPLDGKESPVFVPFFKTGNFCIVILSD